MSIEQELRSRSPDLCELCGTRSETEAWQIPPSPDGTADQAVLLCTRCRAQVERSEPLDVEHWRSLVDTMWSELPAVQVMAWRMLRRVRAEGWAADALDMLYLADDVRIWAEAGDDSSSTHALGGALVHRDSNGTPLSAGDTVTLIKDLNVKGASFTAKRGTAVRGISLVQDNEGHIEGRINGQQIVILTEFVKKSG
jgi:protein PhnA